MPDQERPLGRLPSPPDARDYQFAALLSVPAILPVLPRRYVVRSSRRVPRYNQQEGSCVGRSAAHIKRVQERRDLYRDLPIDGHALWRRSKELDGLPDPTSDRGTYPRVMLELLKTEGAPLEGEAGFDPRYRIDSYWSLATVDEVKAAIYAFGPVMLASAWYGSWWSTEEDGLLLPAAGGVVGGHAFVGYGWDNEARGWPGREPSVGSFLCANSWGQTWGIGGDFRVPYAAFGAELDEAWKPIDARDI